ncbi:MULTISPECIES: hypothetical protein [unclassified Bacillus (in: firmicutes)]
MVKKKNRANKKQNEKIKKLDNEIYSKKLIELEEVIYTYPEKKLLPYFLEEFKHGKNKEYYKKSIATLHDLDIECIEFAISRFSYIDNNKDPNRRYLPVIIPLFGTFLSLQLEVIQITLLGFIIVTGSILWLLKILDQDRKDRSIASSMLKTFEQVHARKQKEKE